jgi:hypothetical protein
MDTLFHIGFIVGGFVAYFILNAVTVSLVTVGRLPSLRLYRETMAAERANA